MKSRMGPAMAVMAAAAVYMRLSPTVEQGADHAEVLLQYH
jgi:hypothetical protein